MADLKEAVTAGKIGPGQATSLERALAGLLDLAGVNQAAQGMGALGALQKGNLSDALTGAGSLAFAMAPMAMGVKGMKAPAEPWILPAYREQAGARRIYAGPTHYEISLPEGLNTLQVDQGFLTDKGHFLDRQKAYDYAQKQGLVAIPPGWRGAELWSEAELKYPQQAYDYLERQASKMDKP